jgi:hypothetical protein
MALLKEDVCRVCLFVGQHDLWQWGKGEGVHGFLGHRRLVQVVLVVGVEHAMSGVFVCNVGQCIVAFRQFWVMFCVV